MDKARDVLLDKAHPGRAQYDKYSWASLHNAHEIVPGLWLGAQELARDGEALRQLGITHMLTVLAGWDVSMPNGCEHKLIGARDRVDQDLLQYFPEAVQFIHNARSNCGVVYVHCAAGVSRSASCVIAYLMTHAEMGLCSAHDLVKQKRSQVDPNTGFLKQLVVWQEAGCTLPPKHLEVLAGIEVEDICQVFGFDREWWAKVEREADQSLRQREARGLV